MVGGGDIFDVEQREMIRKVSIQHVPGPSNRCCLDSFLHTHATEGNEQVPVGWSRCRIRHGILGGKRPGDAEAVLGIKSQPRSTEILLPTRSSCL